MRLPNNATCPSAGQRLRRSVRSCVLSVREEATVKVRMIAGDCHDGPCPTVYVNERGNVVVQGYTVTRAEGMTLADDESAVEIPAHLIKTAAEGLA